MAVGDVGQALEAVVAEHQPGALTKLTGCRPRESAVQGINLGQQTDVGVGVAAGEGLGGLAAPIPDQASLLELADQAGHLGP